MFTRSLVAASFAFMTIIHTLGNASLAANTVKEVLLPDEIQWEPLNPLRGDKSPQAAPLWGGLKSNESTAFLVKFRNGFSSPPHIHNVTYRGVVLSGLVHNDDPNATTMWMPQGSFWTQPAGEKHITSAKGETNIAYIEIDQGPYLVRPPKEAIETSERPVNIEKSNLVWINGFEIDWIVPENVQASFLWGKRERGHFNGTMVKLPANFKGSIVNDGEIFRGIIIEGQADYKSEETEDIKTLTPGSYFGAKGKAQHHLVTNQNSASVVYIRTNGPFKIVADK